MNKTLLEKTADKLVNAFVKNKIIAPLPTKFTKKLSEAQKLRKLCESKVKDPIIGFKAAGTGIPVMKKLKEKKPFYASIFEKNFIKSGKKVKINKSTLGVELEVCYLIKKNFFSLGIYLQIIALSMASASIIQPFHYTLIFWAIIFGYIFYNDIPDLFTIVGAVIITLSGIFVLTQSTKS